MLTVCYSAEYQQYQEATVEDEEGEYVEDGEEEYAGEDADQ